ncbi:MAG: peptide chain release factor-like protein [Deltaproteobacteria bacterium]|nr:peptide chain release factor-like protein [Deltaproteobacteria bacterium]MBI3294003.1 peptide chain release factor-like protein [Deltaproteobacteria bacterium]
MIRPEDLEIVHVRGSGPGGQNRNKRWTGVRVTHLPTGIVVMATERRSQSQNLAAAMERLEDRLRILFTVKKKRVKTRPKKGAIERRLESKRRQGSKKTDRRFPSD